MEMQDVLGTHTPGPIINTSCLQVQSYFLLEEEQIKQRDLSREQFDVVKQNDAWFHGSNR